MDNQTYGADDLNFMLSRLTTQGVSLFRYSDGDNPLLSLNDAVSSFTEPGVDFFNIDACKVVHDNTLDSFKISNGTAFMYDGSFISFEDNGYDLTPQVLALRKESDDTIWVYLYRDIPQNNINVILTTDDAQIDEEKSVILASINKNNEVFDLRTFSKTKIAPSSSNIVKIDETPQFIAFSSHTGATRLRATFKQVFDGAKYCYCYNQIFEIQKIATETGDELDYVHAPLASGEGLYVAFNLYNGELQLWATGALRGTNTLSSPLYIF